MWQHYMVKAKFKLFEMGLFRSNFFKDRMKRRGREPI